MDHMEPRGTFYALQTPSEKALLKDVNPEPQG